MEKGGTMPTIESTGQVLDQPGAPFTLDEDHLAAVAFLARYRGRTLEAYRHDLRALFQWAADHDLAVLEAARTHLELYRPSMEERGLAASTIDGRLDGLWVLPVCPH
jgi:site-specific recombinase XerD